MADLLHLRPEVREMALLPAAERLALVPAHRWIGYTRAGQALVRMEAMLAREPGRVRPRCLLVVGPTHNGKTAIAQHFLRAHPQHASADGEHEVIPAGRERIGVDEIEAADYQPPTVRRRLFERELR